MSRERRQIRPSRRPFWLPASTYYFLTVAVTLGVFFLAWAILAEANEESPWIGAGLLASSTMILGVVLREVIFRYRRNSLYSAQRRIDNLILSVPFPVKREDNPSKLTLDRNSFLLDEIKKKSEAAKVLGNLAESHREVFALCAQYIEVANRELPNVGVGSPRLVAIKRGRDKAQRVHEYHMLRWAELQIKGNVTSSNFLDSVDGLQGLRRALIATEEALSHYPDNIDLIQSRAAIEAFLESEASTEIGEPDRSLASIDRSDSV